MQIMARADKINATAMLSFFSFLLILLRMFRASSRHWSASSEESVVLWVFIAYQSGCVQPSGS